MAQKVSNNNAKKHDIEKFTERLDKLYDLTRCRCPIMKCSEFEKCENQKDVCKKEFHITCNCVREEKLPLLELGFIYSQRSKRGEKGGMQISGVIDKNETARQEKLITKKLEKEARKANREVKKSEEEEALFARVHAFNIEFDPNNDRETVTDSKKTDNSTELLKKRNMLDISQAAETAIW